MNGPWSENKDFGDLFEEQVKNAVEIESELIFSGTVKDALPVVDFDLADVEDDRQIFVIQRKVKGEDVYDQHVFLPLSNAVGEVEVEWRHWKPAFKSGKPLFISRLDNEKSANELTRILGKHWDFSRYL